MSTEGPSIDSTAALARLVFPLNVYALALHFEEGRATALHYGFDWTSGPIGDAQRRATDVLLARLPAPPRRVLEVGIGFGSLGRELTDRGYAYQGLCPDPAQVALARQCHPDLDVQGLAFQDLPLREPCDLLLFQESAQYIDLRDILRIAARVVAPGGSIVVADEVPATTLRALMQPGSQDGFKLAAVEDVTSRARGSLDYLIEAVFGHRPRILQAAGLHSHRLTALLHSLEQRRLAYRDGRHRYIIARLDRIDDSSQAPMGVAQQRLA